MYKRQVIGLQKGPRAVLDVHQQDARSAGQLLAHDAGADQGQAVHGGGDVPEGVQLFVGNSSSESIHTPILFSATNEANAASFHIIMGRLQRMYKDTL